MNSPLRDFKHHRRVALEADHKEVTMRLVGLLDWMEGVPSIARILKRLAAETVVFWQDVEGPKYGWHQPPQARTAEEIASVGLKALEKARESTSHLHHVADALGITGKGNYSSSDGGRSEAIVSRYVVPLLDYVEQ